VPELAEAETIRRDIQTEFAGRRVTSVEVTGIRSVRRHADPASFVSRVVGRTLASTGRRGKFVLLNLDSGDVVVAHMGMSGQLLRASADDPRQPHTHVRLSFEGSPDLRFVDPRTFGQMWVTTPVGGVVPELAHLGFDPLDDPEAERHVLELVRRPTKLKPLLMDQSRIVGIGNMYADEILWSARLRPDRPAASISATDGRRLYRSAVSVLTDAIAHRGSSLADEQYRDIYGRIGAYQKKHRVYAREGQPCRRCRNAIERVRFQGRSSFFCAVCQL
jgi:formamidopyrimidine-DNA glycosylase